MSASRGLGRAFGILYRTSTSSRTHSSLVRAQRSPFLDLFGRNRNHPSIRHQLQRRNFSSARASRQQASANASSKPAEAKSLSQRLKDLSREYGWTAVGVYFALSALDFPFCFLAVRSIGTEKIGEWEHAIIGWLKEAIPFQVPDVLHFWGKQDEGGQGSPPGQDHGVEEADKANRGDSASIWTQLALAYAIHKSFIFIRVPATAAVLPKVVKTLRSRGWNIGKRKPKVDQAGQTGARSG